jgi:hypothetical protein
MQMRHSDGVEILQLGCGERHGGHNHDVPVLPISETGREGGHDTRG